MSRGLFLKAEAASHLDGLRALSTVLPPTAVFTHLSAAEARGWWLPARVAHPVFAAVSKQDPHPQRAGLIVTRHPRAPMAEVEHGVRLAPAADVMLAAARDLGVLDLVVMGDSALRRRDCTPADLAEAAARRQRGARQLRLVVPLLDPRSESPWESVMRVLHQAAEIEVEPQRKIYDEAGHFVARADLWVVGTRRIHEYDGEVHRDLAVHRQDLDRDRRLIQVGWQRCGFTAREVLRGGAQIIASADQLLERGPDPRRLARWDELVSDSLYGEAGRARVAARWGLPN